MMPIQSYEEYKAKMTERSVNDSFVSCILFINKNDITQKAGKEILSNIYDFHIRSGSLISFFLPGYYDNVLAEAPNNCFEREAFANFIKDLEKISTWRYSGETEMLFLNMNNGELDFTTVYDYKLDSMIKKENLDSFDELFNRLIKSLEKDKRLHLGSLAVKKITIEAASALLDAIGGLFNRTFPNIEKLLGTTAFLPKNYARK